MLKKTNARLSSNKKITFALPVDHPAGKVSVVGTFNDWTPGALPLKKRANGTMSASVSLPAGEVAVFRYLGENGWWFDEPEADRITGDGSIIEAA